MNKWNFETAHFFSSHDWKIFRSSNIVALKMEVDRKKERGGGAREGGREEEGEWKGQRERKREGGRGSEGEREDKRNECCCLRVFLHDHLAQPRS